MSIEIQALKSLISQRKLFSIPALSPGRGCPRVILASETLMSDLTASGPGADLRLVAELRADLDVYITGDPITVGGPRDKHADFKPLARTKHEVGFSTHEVWEFRSVDPVPAIRVFGRFARRNVFVGTHWHYRVPLGEFGSLEWRREIRRCKHIWNRILGSRDPLHGVNVHDYISNPVVDLRDP
jgi:hypothetical protein